ncbi:MAG: viroplasmin family protein [Meiothermus sp.]|jgi:ribonuclease HI|uniref:ribonuclease H1 domain-containing protein n=1 Tax=Meiothermus TaxID=65551 RepID=UPI00055D7CF7|nr:MULTISPECIES: viroplasmin family protein [Meiothermus]MDT7921247.1 viroplasmin family protein [Meiothermus sp.]
MARVVKPKSKYYVVWKGRKTGIFTSWPEAEAQVKGFVGAQYKAFENLDKARRAFAGEYQAYLNKKASQARLLQAPPPIIPSYCVDAACSGNPGRLEYRCVDTATRKEIFRRGPFAQGTNNVGEFLAIVEALMLCQEKGYTWPIYSDSVNAIAWVKAKKARTNLIPTAQNAELFERIARAEAWLGSNTYRNPILKWQTDLWGENPADFGRK